MRAPEGTFWEWLAASFGGLWVLAQTRFRRVFGRATGMTALATLEDLASSEMAQDAIARMFAEAIKSPVVSAALESVVGELVDDRLEAHERRITAIEANR